MSNPQRGGKLVIISAPSGAGKTTLCQRLLNDFPDDLELSISTTTRKPRGDEINGREYYFLSSDEFDEKVRTSCFVEWARVHGHCYGTLRSVIEKIFLAMKNALLDIDVQGAASLVEAYPGQCIRIFISPPNLEELRARLETRATDSPQTIAKRLEKAKWEMSQATQYDKLIINDELDRAYNELRTFIAERL